MNLTHDGLTMWFGTPDAPAPFDEEVVPRAGASLVIGVHPSNPTNSITVRYRVDQGVVQTVPGRILRTDYARDAQYFSVAFPRFISGEGVEFWPLFVCGGRQVPAAALADRFGGSFKLEIKRAAAGHTRF